MKEESLRIQAAILGTIEKHDPQGARVAAEQHMLYIDHLLGGQHVVGS